MTVIPLRPGQTLPPTSLTDLTRDLSLHMTDTLEVCLRLLSADRPVEWLWLLGSRVQEVELACRLIRQEIERQEKAA